MCNLIKLNLFFFLITFFFISTYASDEGLAKDPILGKWKTIDKNTKKTTSIIELYLVNGELNGKIIKVMLGKGVPENPKCLYCSGERENKPIEGMNFIYGLKKVGNKWVGGKVIDLRNVPWQGTTVSCKMWLENGKAKIKAFFLFPVFGSEDTWERNIE